jgi:hypothetical protein
MTLGLMSSTAATAWCSSASAVPSKIVKLSGVAAVTRAHVRDYPPDLATDQ